MISVIMLCVSTVSVFVLSVTMPSLITVSAILLIIYMLNVLQNYHIVILSYLWQDPVYTQISLCIYAPL